MSRQNRHEQPPQTVTKTELSHQSVMIDLMGKLLEETRQNNLLLKEFLTGEKGTPRSPSRGQNYASVKKASTGIGFHPSNGRTVQLIHHPTHLEPLREQNSQMQGTKFEDKIVQKHQQQDIYRKTLLYMQNNMKDMAETNRLLFEKLKAASDKTKKEQSLSKDPLIPIPEAEDLSVINKQLQKLLKPKEERRNFGILTQIMPFSDKREIKVRFRIMELLQSGKINESLLLERTGQWVGMVFRATASICWNMLVNSILEYEEVKVLFTENIIFNFITFMNDTHNILDQDTRAKLTEHINNVACQSLEFLCKQYPQTKVQAPNIALRKSIPMIENQGLAKFDLVAMVCRDGIQGQRSRDEVRFEIRDDKEYAHIIMKTINYIIEKTEEQYPQFEKIMSNIFQKIYISKEKRGLPQTSGQLNTVDAQYREKVIKYSSYIIGRKVPKNTVKYSPSEIESGVFFVKSPSVLRIVSKWLEQLYEFVNTPEEKLRTSTVQLKNHAGKALSVSSRVRNALWEQVVDKFPKIQTKVQRLKQQCFNMQLMLTGEDFTTDQKQLHLSEEQLGVGKFCSNLRDAVSSYVCAQLSKIIYYILLVPREVNETRLGFSNEEMEEQARKQLDQTNLITLKIFDLLRCKCHSNEEEILWIVEALKKLEKEDPKFELVRVKDRLNQGTRDILINAQYDGGLVWEIQLAVTSHLDKKQDLLDKYNHFLYELKRTKLGPLSECVTVWATLQQRASYFEQLSLKKRPIRIPSPIVHKRKDCSIRDFSQFKRSTICESCRQYDSIPINSLLNVRCQKCRVTYCGTCYYNSLSQMDKKKFMFQNFDKKKLMNVAAFHELVEYTDFKQPFPKQGFFIRKKFLNRSLSYYTAVIIDYDCQDPDEFEISLAETVIKDNQIDSRCIHVNQIDIKVVDGEYYLKPPYKELKDFWFFYYKNKKSQLLTFRQLDEELRDHSKSKDRYLSLLFSPNYMSELRMIQKQFDKLRLLENLNNVEGVYDLKFGVHRFPHFNVIAKVEVQEERLKKLLIHRQNEGLLMGFVEKKMTVINMEQCDLTDELDNMSKFNSKDVLIYFERIQKVYLADNLIESIEYSYKLKNLETLSISKNCLKSLKGVQNLTKLYYIKFDENKISSLVQLTNLVNLTYVSGNANLISSLKGMQKLEKLGSLSLCSNRIFSIEQLSNIPYLKRIYLRDNPITHIEPLSNTHIHHLFIGLTKINPMDIKKFTALGGLKEIALKELNLTAIPKIFDKLKNLKSLKLSKNKIKRIDNLQILTNLVGLDLSQNEITVMQNLSALDSLQQLKLKSNKIKVVTDVKTFIESLRILNLQLNPLDDLQDYLIFEEKVLGMRLKYTEEMLTEQAKAQIRNHAIDINNKSQSDD